MSEGTIFIILTSYYLLLSFPLIFFVDRGRKSGRITPKLCSTLLSVFYIGLPFFVVGIIFRQRFVPLSLQYWGFVTAALFLFWLAVYAGPMGAGWTGKWDNYVYPSRKKELEKSLPTESGVATRPDKLSKMMHTWRFWTMILVLSGMAILVGGGLIIHSALLIVIGIVVPLIHLVAFLAIWYWKQKQLEEKGWRW